MLEPLVGFDGVCVSRSIESLESDGRCCVHVLGTNLTSVAMKMFNILETKFYKFCTFNVIHRHNAAINYTVSVQHKERPAAVTSDRLYCPCTIMIFQLLGSAASDGWTI
jgi:hypothetical protein